MRYLFLVVWSLSTQSFAATIYLLKQWHLLPKVQTQDIELSKKLAQYTSQKDVYLKVMDLIKNNKVKYLLAEGCENDEINQNFKLSFNSWSYLSLKKLAKQSSYDDIMTHIPLKVEVLQDKNVKTLCVDNLKLIEMHQLALSDVRAYVGFFIRLKEFKEKKDEKNFEKYVSSLLSSEELKSVKDPLEYAKEKSFESLEKLQKINTEREKTIFENIKGIKTEKDENVALVVGGLHVSSLEKMIQAMGSHVEVFTPVGYVESDADLIGKLKEYLK